MLLPVLLFFFLFFFNDTATTEIYTLSLHDALPIYQGDQRALAREQGLARRGGADGRGGPRRGRADTPADRAGEGSDRKSTRLNSSHSSISYAVFCLKKKKKKDKIHTHTQT